MHYASLEDQELQMNTKKSENGQMQQNQHNHPMQQQMQQQNHPMKQQMQQQNQQMQQIHQQMQQQNQSNESPVNENSSGQYLPSLMQGIDSLPKETVYLRSKIPSNPHLPMIQIKPYQE